MKQRVITGIIFGALLLPLIIFGGYVSYVYGALITGIGTYELLRIGKIKKLPISVWILTYFFNFVLLGYSIGIDCISSIDLLTLININLFPHIVLILLYLIILLSLSIVQKDFELKDALYVFGYSLIIVFGASSIWIIRNALNWNGLLYVLGVTMLTDMFALFSGKLFGKHKLCPEISPNKTTEGLIGGVLVSAIISYAFYLIFSFFQFEGHYIWMILITIFLSIFSATGDLMFSHAKRNFGIKDFSNLLPGHGGLLDRLDSLLIVSIVFMFILSLIAF